MLFLSEQQQRLPVKKCCLLIKISLDPSDGNLLNSVQWMFLESRWPLFSSQDQRWRSLCWYNVVCSILKLFWNSFIVTKFGTVVVPKLLIFRSCDQGQSQTADLHPKNCVLNMLWPIAWWLPNLSHWLT